MRSLLNCGTSFVIGWSGQAIPVAIFLFTGGISVAASRDSFEQEVRPFLQNYCLKCHNDEVAESGIRLDQLNGTFEQQRLRLWEGLRKQITNRKMPPEDASQPTTSERDSVLTAIDEAIRHARSRPDEFNGSVRRLTVIQYQNTLRDLLRLRENITASLPADAVSKDGFTNNVQSMLLSPLQVESYLSIARNALNLCIVDEDKKPVIQTFRMDLGKGINSDPYPDQLILGANSSLLENSDFEVIELNPLKPFPFEPFQMQTRFRFIEGYQGNDTVRGWRDYDSIYHAVFACVRGADGYPKGKAWETIPSGLLLRPSIPGQGLFGVDSTYGPKANFKVSLRELPAHGNFRVTVTAAKYNDGLLLDAGETSHSEPGADRLTISEPEINRSVNIKRPGIYQAEIFFRDTQPLEPVHLNLTIDDRWFSGLLYQPAFVVLRLPAGVIDIIAQTDGRSPSQVVLTKLADHSELAQRFTAFEHRSPRMGVHVGLRRDCGSTLAPAGVAQTVTSTELSEFVFEDAINNFPSPEVEKDNVNYLAGLREISVRSEYTDGRDIPRLLIRSIHFEGPLFETWPPEHHRRIFINSDHPTESAEYADEIIRSFATKAFRRPLTADEKASFYDIWQKFFNTTGSFTHSVRNTLGAVLTSPQFLFLVERSETPDPEPLDEWELASKLSYFLWNTAPDEQLLGLAATNQLYEQLDAQIDRMVSDRQFSQCMEQFVSQWLDLSRFDVVEIDHLQFPELTPHVRSQLRKEPVNFVQHLIRANLPLRNLVRSDFALANEVVAAYYGLGDSVESGFDFVVFEHDDSNLGGVLTQAGILAGLSNGRESNPVKRGAWLARRIIAEPPADPPPNVPALPEDQSQMPLREKLKRHRDQEGCVGCHIKIDPWGLPLEQYDAGGLFRHDIVDGQSTLPDGTTVVDMVGLKSYLAVDRIDQVAFSFLKHVAGYAVGRSLTYNEIEFLRKHALELKPQEYRMLDMLRFVIRSDLFLMK
ncbi:MAG: DUF1592 domain-containing protein [Fuerstiella sp.]|nr:DUF1592 domain-containing protein [Fuerstiella sp.]